MYGNRCNGLTAQRCGLAGHDVTHFRLWLPTVWPAFGFPTRRFDARTHSDVAGFKGYVFDSTSQPQLGQWTFKPCVWIIDLFWTYPVFHQFPKEPISKRFFRPTGGGPDSQPDRVGLAWIGSGSSDAPFLLSAGRYCPVKGGFTGSLNRQRPSNQLPATGWAPYNPPSGQWNGPGQPNEDEFGLGFRPASWRRPRLHKE